MFGAALTAAVAKPPPELPRWLLQRTLGHWVGLLLAGVPLLTLRRDALLRAWAAPRRAWTLLLLITLLCSTLAVIGFSAALGTLPWLLACIPMVLLAALLVHAGHAGVRPAQPQGDENAQRQPQHQAVLGRRCKGKTEFGAGSVGERDHRHALPKQRRRGAFGRRAEVGRTGRLHAGLDSRVKGRC